MKYSKKASAVILAFAIVMISFVSAFAAGSGAASYNYKTDTVNLADPSNRISSIRAALKIPNYLGTVSATIKTSEGVGDFTVPVIYVPGSKWDNGCYYSGITASIASDSGTIFGSYDSLVQWNEYYDYGFLPMGGGIYILDSDSIQMNFLEGPGLYTALASFYYTPSACSFDKADDYAASLGYADAQALLSARPDLISMSAVGYPFILVLDDSMIDYFMENGTLTKYSSYSWPGLKDLILSHRSGGPSESVSGLSNFTDRRRYFTGIFSDIGSGNAHWYDTYAQTTYSLGLIEGIGTEFKGNGTLTLAQAIAMACRVHNIYGGGNGQFTENPNTWYSVYVSYAIKNGIIKTNDFNADRDHSVFNKNATRAQMAYIFSNALPASALPAINNVTRIPDVVTGIPYKDNIFTLYKAGILDGSDSRHSFHPYRTITRAEAAAIISRMAKQDLRVKFTSK